VEAARAEAPGFPVRTPDARPPGIGAQPHPADRPDLGAVPPAPGPAWDDQADPTPPAARGPEVRAAERTRPADGSRPADEATDGDDPRQHPPHADPGPELSPRDRQVLDFEGRFWRYQGAKDEAIRAEFDLSPARYYQLLNALIESPAALAAEPMLVRRLQRRRANRRRDRSAAPASGPRSSEA
jgi:hypothetical protein